MAELFNLVPLVIAFSMALFIAFFYLAAFRRTVFGINFKTNNYAGFFLSYELFIFILPAVTILNIFHVSNFYALFKVSQDSIFPISILVIFSLLLFFFALYFFSILTKKYSFFGPNEITLLTDAERSNIISYSKVLLVFCLLILSITIFVLGGIHSFASTIFSDEVLGISSVRFANAQNPLIRYFNHFFIFISPLLAILAASTIFDKKIFHRILFLSAAIVIASFYGSKGPILKVLLAFFVSYLSFYPQKVSFKLVLKFLIFLAFLTVITVWMVTLQYKNFDLNQIILYFVNRIFIAQLAGVYEQFNLHIQNIEYIFHAIPFLNLFTDYPVFHKDLMMISEGRTDLSSIGIKNTLFIAESYAIGGYGMLIFSTVTMAFNYVVAYLWFFYIFKIFVFSNAFFTKKVVPLFFFSYVSMTGGFTDIFFFKITIMMTSFLALSIGLFLIVKSLRRLFVVASL